MNVHEILKGQIKKINNEVKKHRQIPDEEHRELIRFFLISSINSGDLYTFTCSPDCLKNTARLGRVHMVF